ARFSIPANHPSKREKSNGFCSRVSTRITGRGVFSWVPPRSARTGIAGCGTGTADICHFNGDAMRVRCLVISAVSRGSFLQVIFVMQSAKDRPGPDFTILRQSVPTSSSQPLDGSLLIIIRSIRRDSWPQAQVRAALVVMTNPLLQHHSQMIFTERNQKVQTLAPERSHQPFAIGVGLRRPNWRPQHSKT